MSSRFGRNKRRRAREAIAALQNEVTLHRMLIDAERAAHRQTEDRLLACEQEILLAKAIAGPASILFPARSQEHDSINVREFLDVQAIRPLSLSDIRGATSFKAKTVRLHTLVASVSRDWLTENVHTRLTYDGMPIAYAVSRESLLSIPTPELCAFIMREAVPLMAQALADELVTRKGQRYAHQG